MLSQAEEIIGSVQSRLNHGEAALRNHLQSAAIRTVLLKDDPANADDWSRGLVANHVGLGGAVISTNRLRPAAHYHRTALEHYRRALPLCERLYAAHPEQARNSLCGGETAQFLVHRRQGSLPADGKRGVGRGIFRHGRQ